MSRDGGLLFWLFNTHLPDFYLKSRFCQYFKLEPNNLQVQSKGITSISTFKSHESPFQTSTSSPLISV